MLISKTIFLSYVHSILVDLNLYYHIGGVCDIVKLVKLISMFNLPLSEIL